MARDQKLHRDVAIEILAQALAWDSERLTTSSVRRSRCRQAEELEVERRPPTSSHRGIPRGEEQIPE
jgi:hypothetical protein